MWSHSWAASSWDAHIAICRPVSRHCLHSLRSAPEMSAVEEAQAIFRKTALPGATLHIRTALAKARDRGRLRPSPAVADCPKPAAGMFLRLIYSGNTSNGSASQRLSVRHTRIEEKTFLNSSQQQQQLSSSQARFTVAIGTISAVVPCDAISFRATVIDTIMRRSPVRPYGVHEVRACFFYRSFPSSSPFVASPPFASVHSPLCGSV